MKRTGVILMIGGLLLTIFTSVTYFTREKVVDLGKLEITANKRHNFIWSPLIGVAFIGVGAALFLFSAKKLA